MLFLHFTASSTNELSKAFIRGCAMISEISRNLLDFAMLAGTLDGVFDIICLFKGGIGVVMVVLYHTTTKRERGT